MCKCRSAQCRCSSLQPGRRCCCSSRSSAYLPHQGRVEVAKKQQQQGLCCRGRQGPPPGFPSPRPHWSRPVLPGWVAADTAGGGTSAILRSAKSPLSRSAGPNRGEFELQLREAKHPLGTRLGHIFISNQSAIAFSIKPQETFKAGVPGGGQLCENEAGLVGRSAAQRRLHFAQLYKTPRVLSTV